MPDRPAGAVTFLFTDIEGSTELWESNTAAMREALARHDTILRASIETNHGQVVKSTGDGMLAVFGNGLDALNAALAAQGQFLEPLGGLMIRVRMGLHSGEAEFREGDYFGMAPNRAARLMSAAHGGQILISAATVDLINHTAPAPALLRDLGEHRFKGLAHSDRVFQLLHPSLPADFPPIASLNSYPNNLPVQLTSFVGRGRELAKAAEKLSATHLLTLIGPGGTGKTRLSLQIGAEFLTEFKDGVWLVELAPLADPGLVLGAVARALGLREQLGMPLNDVVLNYVRAKHMLLILDNCEHLVEASAQIAGQILQSSPDMKIIASSREALGISGEVIYRVPSLSLLGREDVSAGDLKSCEAALLFIERATAANPSFSLTDQNAQAVGQICRRLDGIPLALELAAARATALSAEQIAARLGDRFKLLTGGSRTALPRQQTLRAAIDWSYDILTDLERALLRRLAVFVGGWTFEAAEAVGGDLDVLDLLTQLVNKSLVVVEEGEGKLRYRMLETIRQYARDKLLEAGESQAVRADHLAYFSRLAHEARPIAEAAEARDTLDNLDVEHDNFRAALEWGIDADLASALEMVDGLSMYWFRRGHAVEGIQSITTVLARAESLPVPEGEAGVSWTKLLASAWGALMFLAYSQGDSPVAYRACEKCIALARRIDDRQKLANALSFGGSALLFMGRFDEAGAMMKEAESLVRSMDNPYGLGIALSMVAQYYTMALRDFQTAEAYENEGIDLLMKHAPGSWGVTMTTFASARSAMMRQDFEMARARFEKCRPAFDRFGDRHRVNMIDSEIAHIERYEGNTRQAAETYRTTLKVWYELGHRAAVAHQLECLAFIAKGYEHGERAAHLLAVASALREVIGIDMNPMERIEYDRELAELKAGMDESAFAEAQARGRAMSLDDAIALALQPD